MHKILTEPAVAALALAVILALLVAARTTRAGDLESCTSPRVLGEAQGVVAEGFDKRRYRVLLEGQDPGHSVQDVVAAPGQTVPVEAKFAYGDGSKDLEDERVRAFLDECTGWRALGEAVTDDDGRAHVDVDTTGLAPGRYRVTFAVAGDASTASGILHVLPSATRVVLFDIDGTLTVGDGEVVKFALDSSNEPEARDGSAELVTRWAEAGYVVVYLTGRPYLYLEHTRSWLARNGFPRGVIRTSDSVSDSMPGVDAVGAFKVEQLAAWRTLGLEIAGAYGNASTDIHAYATAGLASASTWIIGRLDDDDEAVDGWGPNLVAGDDWLDHLRTLDLSDAEQPW